MEILIPIKPETAKQYFQPESLEYKYIDIFPNHHYCHYENAARYERLFEKVCDTKEKLEWAHHHCKLVFDLLELKAKLKNKKELTEKDNMLLLAMQVMKDKYGEKQ